MTVYVLGAGASRRAGYPLGSELRSELEAWGSRSPCSTTTRSRDFRERLSTLNRIYPSDSFDSILTDLYEHQPGSRAASLLAECPQFLVDVLDGFRQYFREMHFRETQSQAPLDYGRLAKLLRRGDVIVTFNYDLALERELKSANCWEIGDGYGFCLYPDSPPASHIKVLKLHGSINWCAAPVGAPGRVVGGSEFVGARPVLGVDADWTYLGYKGLRDPAMSNRVLIGTAMIMPVAHKMFYYKTSYGREWEEFWNSLWNAAEFALRACEEIVIIGYSLPGADERARDLLLCRSNRNARLTVCCGKRDTPPIQNKFRAHGFNFLQEGPTSFHEWLDYEESKRLSHAV